MYKYRILKWVNNICKCVILLTLEVMAYKLLEHKLKSQENFIRRFLFSLQLRMSNGTYHSDKFQAAPTLLNTSRFDLLHALTNLTKNKNYLVSKYARDEVFLVVYGKISEKCCKQKIVEIFHVLSS